MCRGTHSYSRVEASQNDGLDEVLVGRVLVQLRRYFVRRGEKTQLFESTHEVGSKPSV